MTRWYTPVAEKLVVYSVPEPNTGCHLWLGATVRNGYGQVYVGGRQIYAHRASWECEFGPIPEGFSVLHKCDVRCCINPAHLFLGSHVENMNDMKAKGRAARGEASGMAKLSADDVMKIRARCNNGETHRSIAEAFGVTHSTVGTIARRTTWSHIQ